MAILSAPIMAFATPPSMQDVLPEKPMPDRAWLCETNYGVTYCHGRINDSRTEYTVYLSVSSTATSNAVANIYINGNLAQTTGCLRPGQSITIVQSIQWGVDKWTSDYTIGCH